MLWPLVHSLQWEFWYYIYKTKPIGTLMAWCNMISVQLEHCPYACRESCSISNYYLLKKIIFLHMLFPLQIVANSRVCEFVSLLWEFAPGMLIAFIQGDPKDKSQALFLYQFLSSKESVAFNFPPSTLFPLNVHPLLSHCWSPHPNLCLSLVSERFLVQTLICSHVSSAIVLSDAGKEHAINLYQIIYFWEWIRSFYKPL